MDKYNQITAWRLLKKHGYRLTRRPSGAYNLHNDSTQCGWFISPVAAWDFIKKYAKTLTKRPPLGRKNNR